MKAALLYYARRSIVLTLTLFIAIVGLFRFTGLSIYYLPVLPFFLIFFFLFNLLLHYWLLRITKGRKEIFYSRYISAFMAKLLVYLVVFALYAFFHRTEAVIFTIYYVILYIAYTFLEVYCLSAFLKKNP
jgi:hypothetical protein